MSGRFRGGAAPLVLAVLLAAAAAAAEPPTTLVIVRHAEKALEPAGDPVLSPAGEERARRLADMLAGSGLAAVYASETTRARETARPTAERLGLEITPYPPLDLERLVLTILQNQRGRTVLVVGHSNTVPELVRLLGAEDPGPMPETEYDSLFVVTVSLEGQAGVLRLRF